MPPLPSLDFTFDMSRLLAPLSLIIFTLLVDTGTRLIAPMLRDYLQPVFGIPYTIWQWLQQKLARSNRNSIELQKRGALAVVVMTGVAAACAVGFDHVAVRIKPYGVYILWFFIWSWSVGWSLAGDVLRLSPQQIQTSSIVQAIYARRSVKPIPALPEKMDASTVYRITASSVAATLVYGLAAPLFYSLVAAACGLPPFYGAVFGVMGAVWMPNLAADSTTRLFQRPASALAQLILYVPGRIIALLCVIATLFTPKAKTLAALRVMVRQGHLYPDHSLGWVMAVISGAFGIALPMGNNLWLGEGNATAQIQKGALQRVVWLHAITVVITLLILCAALLLSM